MASNRGFATIDFDPTAVDRRLCEIFNYKATSVQQETKRHAVRDWPDNCGPAADREVCAVCMENLYGEYWTVGVLRCQHRFHSGCIGEWLLRKSACPLCRAIVLHN
ncbi:RING finger protein 215-like [Salvia hispanica]|uniref:RING finger protein 215-like n=1 Tax=Salvia hispanica TaxID=49212 RepID=UPI00200997E2|nr:RING finger protein 215-like [Salvia hispanica]